MFKRINRKGKPKIVIVRPGDWLVIANLKSIGVEDSIDPDKVAELTYQLKEFAGLYGCLAVGNDLDQKEVERATYDNP